MRILHICPRYEPAHGGAEDYISTITKWMAKNPDNQVDVWTTDALEVDAIWYPGKQKIDIEQEVIDSVNVRRFKTTPFLMNNLFINKVIRFLLVHAPIKSLRILGTPPTCFDMWAQINNKALPKYDVVHVQSMPYFSLLYIARAIAKKVGAKLYFTSLTHLGTDKNDPLRKKYFDPVGIQFYMDADKIFTLTDTERDAIIEFVNQNGKEISKDKFEKVGVGIFPQKVLTGDPVRFRTKYSLGNTPMLCYVGAKNYVKGTNTLIEAMEILWKKGVNVKLGLSGNTSIEFDNFWKKQPDIVKANTVNLDMPNDVDKLDMFSAANIFCMLSKSESFGIVYLEAWAYKIPVIAADIDIMHEILDVGKDGFVSKFGDAKQLSEKIEILLNDPKKRDEMGAYGYDKVMRYHTWEQKFKILDKYFNERSKN